MEKILTDNASEKITVKWDGERFAVASSRKQLGNRFDIVILNPREMLELVEFASKMGGK